MPSPTAEPALSAASFEELYEDAPCGYVSFALGGAVVRANRTLLESLGRTAAEVEGRPLRDLLAPGSRIYEATHWGPKLELSQSVREVPVVLLRADGTRMHALLNADVRPGGLVSASLFDATDRRRYELQLLSRVDQQAAVARFGTRALAAESTAALVGEAVEVVRLGIEAEHVGLVGPGNPPPAPSDRLHVVALGPAGALVVRTGAEQELSPGDRSFIASVANVVTTAVERRLADEAARHRATHDGLTGLPNRLFLQEQLAAIVATGVRHTIAVLDLDGFKVINDSRGHLAGDELLRAVANRLVTAIGDHGTVGALGADAFAVVCRSATATCVGVELAAALTEALRAPFVVDDVEHVLTATVGTATAGADGDADTLLRDAEIAMDRARDGGRGRHAHFVPAMRTRSQERARIEVELRVALREGQLRVFYQPVVDAATGRTSSMEALVRWEHPEQGLVPPGVFIPVAEESGLVVELGAFVLAESCRQLAAWRADGTVGPDVAVAVNVSARQLVRAGLAGEVRDVLVATGLQDTPHLLILEITETTLMADESHADVLDDLAALGVGLALDDFGTGASALARLKRFPVDTLKIDRAFVMPLGEGDGADEAIIAAVVALASALGLGVVAEGVETAWQHARLTELGCDRLQGFLFSRPLPATELAPRLRAAQS